MRGRRGRDRMVLPVQSVPITTKTLSSNPVHGEVYSNLDTMLCNEVCQLLATGRRFSPGTPVSSTIITDPTPRYS